MKFRPMLAETVKDPASLKFPLFVSPKLDGIRCVIRDGVPMTRNLKPIPNLHVRDMLSGLPDFDGELIVGEPTASDVWNVTSSAIMSRDGKPDFKFYVFDYAHPAYASMLFQARWDFVLSSIPLSRDYIHLCPHPLVHTVDELLRLEEHYVSAGFEGIMVRDPNGPYKWGRSTQKEGYLLKIKRFEDAEAQIVDVTEKMHNANEAKVNALGLTERSSHKANQMPTGMLGALVCQAILREDRKGFKKSTCEFAQSVQFEIGTGFTEAQRIELWKDKPIGRIVKFKYQGLTPDGVPRFPVFLGFRDERDM